MKKSEVALEPLARTLSGPNPTVLAGEDLTLLPDAELLEKFRGSSHFFPVVVLIPKSAVGNDAIIPAAAIKETTNGHAPSLQSELVDSLKEWLAPSAEPDEYVFGEVRLRFSAMLAYRNGQSFPLKNKECKLLQYLIRRPGQVISRGELLDKVWGYECYPCTRTVDNHILLLRRKLETEPSRPRHLVTVHRAGYKFLP